MRAVAVAMLLAGCTASPTQDLSIPTADPTVFKDRVYPILLRDCGFTTCHGDPKRFFAVFGPGRVRLEPDKTDIYDPVTPYELAISYTRARSMLFGPDGPDSSLLVRKPIPLSEGGAGHKGDDVWGSPIFLSTADARYVTLYNWATTQGVR